MRDQNFNERPAEAPPQSKLPNPGETKKNPSILLIRDRSSMRDQNLNERPGEAPKPAEAPPKSKLPNPGETKKIQAYS
jgi:hypothetical protein